MTASPTKVEPSLKGDMEEQTEAAQPWMKKSSQLEVHQYLSDIEKAKKLKQFKGRYKIIADLMSGREADLTLDPEWFARVNREELELEEYMKCFPQDCEDAMWAVRRDKEYISGPNMKSLARWYAWGHLPSCINELFTEMYPDEKARKAAYRRFFNTFHRFRIPDKNI